MGKFKIGNDFLRILESENFVRFFSVDRGLTSLITHRSSISVDRSSVGNAFVIINKGT